MDIPEKNENVVQKVEYDLHGIVGIQLVNPGPGDISAVTRQLGPIQARLNREPDIVIEFVDHLTVSSKVHYLGVDEVGFTEDAFIVLNNKHSRVRVQIPLDQVGGQCRITCETGVPAVPLLIPTINLTALANGALPLHASAFTYNGTGVLTTGWSKGGKTETLLAFMQQGASYIGDEWVYISTNGQHMFGIPEPIRVWDWHLQYLPQYRARVRPGDFARLRAIKFVQALDRTLVRGPMQRLLPNQIMKKVRSALKRQLYVDIHPQKLFGEGFGHAVGKLEKVLFVGTHDAPDVVVRPIESEEIARRMVFSLQYERLNFMAYYLAFRFAFPEIRNTFIEEAEEIQRERLIKVLQDKQPYAVYHPYPVRIPALFDAICPLL